MFDFTMPNHNVIDFTDSINQKKWFISLFMCASNTRRIKVHCRSSVYKAYCSWSLPGHNFTKLLYGLRMDKCTVLFDYDNFLFFGCRCIELVPKGYSKPVNSKKNRQHNDQQKKYKRTNNDLQNITHQNKYWVTLNTFIPNTTTDMSVSRIKHKNTN
jgi:hypothetical protein